MKSLIAVSVLLIAQGVLARVGTAPAAPRIEMPKLEVAPTAPKGTTVRPGTTGANPAASATARMKAMQTTAGRAVAVPAAANDNQAVQVDAQLKDLSNRCEGVTSCNVVIGNLQNAIGTGGANKAQIVARVNQVVTVAQQELVASNGNGEAVTEAVLEGLEKSGVQEPQRFLKTNCELN